MERDRGLKKNINTLQQMMFDWRISGAMVRVFPKDSKIYEYNRKKHEYLTNLLSLYLTEGMITAKK